MTDARAIADEAVSRWAARQMPYELAGLLELIRPGDVVVEVGCDAGGVLWAFREAGAGRVIGVDLPQAAYSGDRRLTTHGAEMVVGNSQLERTQKQVRELLGGQLVDLLFIDADHTYLGVRRDFRAYAPLVRPGGLAVFHDICHHSDFPEVQVEKLWWEIKAKNQGRTAEIIYYMRPWGSGMGIGVLRHG